MYFVWLLLDDGQFQLLKTLRYTSGISLIVFEGAMCATVLPDI